MRRDMYILNLPLLKRSTVKDEQFISLYKFVVDNQDSKNASKIVDLFKKANNNKRYFGFTGHFSAGKSSMINALLEEDILPKSPIPTSGNIVEITSHINDARVFFNDKTYVTYAMPYDADQIKAYCTDNVSIQKVTLGTAKQLIPKGNVILDTPGIDAANDVDRLITESSLHLIDHLYYVTDYNHVQSDINVTFLQQIQEKGIPFSLIINQIDKHNQEEITFKQFKYSVALTFNQWGIYPKKTYYTTLLQPSMKHSEFNELKQDFFDSMSINESNEDAVFHALKQVMIDHKQFLLAQKEEALSNITVSDYTISETRLNEAEQALEQLQKKQDTLEQEFQAALNNTLKNAYLMPATLRDKAALFLESVQDDFKIGFFASKKKTELEKKARINDFLTELQQIIESTIEWKLRDKIIDLLSANDMSSPTLMEETKSFSIHYRETDLLSLINKGARINGDYVLHYTNNVSAAIKNKFKGKARILWSKIQKEVQAKLALDIKQCKDELYTIKSAYEQNTNYAIIKANYELKIDEIFTLWENTNISKQDHIFFNKDLNRSEKEYKKREEPVVVSKSQINEKVVSAKEIKSYGTEKYTSKQMTNMIEQAIKAIEGLPMFQSLIKDLQSKKSRIQNQQLTVALFGAFSAGKSSFANALIGEKVLPSTPQPTTAVINQIAPPTNEHPHGTVYVRVKDEQELMEDILEITNELSPPTSTSLGDLIDWLVKKNITESNQLNKTYCAYLQALINGFDKLKDSLNSEFTISLSVFSSFVVDETKACYVESVTLHYDCSLTRMGITLVDTPGADSMNARHTNVAFNYVKKADAILYLTYYNHALSRADKDFLTQLGNVKDAFELDKMFFLINASDLAMDDQELHLVVNYVHQQLLSLGIRLPKLYPISSKLSLKEKLSKTLVNKQMNTFEKEFYQFIKHDLIQLVIQASMTDLKRVHYGLTDFIQTTQLNETEKEAKKQQLITAQTSLLHMVNEASGDRYLERIHQRIGRQFFFLEERMAIRFHDLFKDVFNPATLNESGKRLTIQFDSCLKNMLHVTGMELLREVQAICIRIESFLRELHGESQEDYKERCGQIDQHLIIPSIELNELKAPNLERAFQTMNENDFPSIRKQFKGTKAFFQKNDRDKIRDQFYQLLQAPMKEYLNEAKLLMERSYITQWQSTFTNSKLALTQFIEEYTHNHLEMMTTPIDVKDLKNRQQTVASLFEC